MAVNPTERDTVCSELPIVSWSQVIRILRERGKDPVVNSRRLRHVAAAHQQVLQEVGAATGSHNGRGGLFAADGEGRLSVEPQEPLPKLIQPSRTKNVQKRAREEAEAKDSAQKRHRTSGSDEDVIVVEDSPPPSASKLRPPPGPKGREWEMDFEPSQSRQKLFVNKAR
jgi:hypothetical protein